MKPEIHPDYRPVAFQAISDGTTFVIPSTVEATETTVIDDIEYQLVKVEVSSSSHPFFTGKMQIVDTAGRGERFERRYGARRNR